MFQILSEHEENFSFLFKSMFLRIDGWIEKTWNSFAAAPPNKSDSLQNFNYCSTPTDFFFQKQKKLYPPPI